MTDFELFSFGIFTGGLISMALIGVGVIIEDVRHYFADKGTTETRRICDNDADTVLCKRHCDRGGDNGCDKEVNHDD